MPSIFKKTIALLAIIGLGALSIPLINNPGSALASTIPTPIAQFQTSLASSISANDTSMSLAAAADKEGNTLASSTYAFVIDEGTGLDEFVTANCTGTTCTGLTRGVSVLSGTTSVSSLKKAHRRGASVKITDAPLLLIIARIANGQDTFPNKLTYATTPSLSNALDIAYKGYVDTYGASSTAYANGTFVMLAGSNAITANNTFSGTNAFQSTVSFSTSPTTPTPSGNTDVANKAYVDGVVTGGAPIANNTTTGIMRTATSTQYSKGFSSTTPYALTSAFASSTASTSPIIVSSNTNGKIDPSFLNGSNESYTFNASTTVNGTSTLNGAVINGDGAKLFRYGGTGVDGPLSVSSGTTTIDLGGLSYVVKNYSSVSITSTGRIAFSNPHANGTTIIFKVAGDMTVTSSNDPAIDLKGLGGTEGAGVGTIGVGNYGGTGGRGAAAFGFEVAGKLNLTGIIDANGKNGINGGGSANYGGGGGGAGGVIFGTANFITANSPTLRVAAGSGVCSSPGGGTAGSNGANGSDAIGATRGVRGGQAGGPSSAAPTTFENWPNILTATTIGIFGYDFLVPGAGGGGGSNAASGPCGAVGHSISGTSGTGFASVAARP